MFNNIVSGGFSPAQLMFITFLNVALRAEIINVIRLDYDSRAPTRTDSAEPGVPFVGGKKK